MRIQPAVCLFLVGWLLGLLFSAPTCAQVRTGKPECIPTRDPSRLKSRESELRATAEKLLETFRDDDKKAFLSLVHPKYFGMGESRNYTLRELKRLFRIKKDIYCDLFDTSCIPAPAGESISFKQAAMRTEARVDIVEVTAGVGIDRPGCSGTANIAWTDPIDSAYVSTFTFMRVGNQWKTIGFDLPLSAPPKPSDVKRRHE